MRALGLALLLAAATLGTGALASPVVCVGEEDDPLLHACWWTFGSVDEGCVETRVAGTWRGTCYTLPSPL